MRIMNYVERVLRSNPLPTDKFWSLIDTQGFNRDSVRRVMRRHGIKFSYQENIELPKEYFKEKEALEEMKKQRMREAGLAAGGRKRKGHRFELEDIHGTVCVFIKRSDGEMDILVNKDYHDNVLYNDPIKYKETFLKVKEYVEDEIKKAQDVLDTTDFPL